MTREESVRRDGITVISINTDSDGEAETRGVLTKTRPIMTQIDALSGQASAA